jgi:hypothetical protein
MRLDQDSTDFRYFIAKIWFLLFFTVSASKSRSLLITANAAHTNRIQRENLFNDAIASQEYFSYSSHPLQKTNFLKPRRAVTSRRRKRGVLSLRAADTRRAVTSRRRYEACCHVAPPIRGVLSRRAADCFTYLRALRRQPHAPKPKTPITAIIMPLSFGNLGFSSASQFQKISGLVSDKS